METVRNTHCRETENQEPLWPFGSRNAGPGFVTLTSGVYQEVVTAGRPVSELREQYGVGLDLDPQARAVVNGQEVNESYCPKPSETVVWTRRAGEKGGMHPL